MFQGVVLHFYPPLIYLQKLNQRTLKLPKKDLKLAPK